MGKKQAESPSFMGVEEVKLQEQVDFLGGVLPGARARVLDAGCGRGTLARRLLDLGYEVVGVDHDPDAISAARLAGVPAVESDFTTYHHDDPFDVVMFSASLHHMVPLGSALDRAAMLLRPGGLLIADEFVADYADQPAAGWYYDTVALLTAAGALTPGDQLPAGGDPVERWQAQHGLEPRNPGDLMLAEIRRRFAVRSEDRVPHLYRYLAEWLEDGERGRRIAAELLAIERCRVAHGDLAATGLRVVAARPA